MHYCKKISFLKNYHKPPYLKFLKPRDSWCFHVTKMFFFDVCRLPWAYNVVSIVHSPRTSGYPSTRHIPGTPLTKTKTKRLKYTSGIRQTVFWQPRIQSQIKLTQWDLRTSNQDCICICEPHGRTRNNKRPTFLFLQLLLPGQEVIYHD